MALGEERLTTKQLQARLPHVAQASLYRAVSRLVDAGVLDVVETRRRGGAIERVYAAAPLPEGGTAAQEAVRAAADIAGKSIVVDACRWLNDSGHNERVAVHREVLHLSPERALRLRHELDRLLDEARSAQPHDGCEAYALTVTMFPAGIDR